MTQNKTPVAPAGVPALDAVTQCPKSVPARVLGDAISGGQADPAQSASLADLRSPADCYHPEAYLIGCLVRLYGWRVTEPGTLRRSWRAQEVRLAAAPAATAGSVSPLHLKGVAS